MHSRLILGRAETKTLEDGEAVQYSATVKLVHQPPTDYRTLSSRQEPIFEQDAFDQWNQDGVVCTSFLAWSFAMLFAPTRISNHPPSSTQQNQRVLLQDICESCKLTNVLLVVSHAYEVIGQQNVHMRTND